MSGNQKQAPPGAAQTQSRYAQSYVAKPSSSSNKYVPQWKEAWQQNNPEWMYSGAEFHVQQQFMPQQQQQQQQQQPPNQSANQGPQQLRNMAPTGPPTQASTPPNADIKPNLYAQQPPPRTAPYYPRQPQANANAAPRVVNQRTNQIYSSHPTQMMTATSYPLAIQSMPFQANFGQRSYYPVYQTGSVTAYQPPFQLPAQTYYYSQTMARQAPQQVAPVPHSVPHGPSQATPMGAPAPMPPTSVQKKPPRKGSKAIQIINPETMLPIDNDEPHATTSGESSARQTPQPAPPNKEVQATFAKQVAQLINSDVPTTLDASEASPASMDGGMYHAPSAAAAGVAYIDGSQQLPPPPPFQMPAAHVVHSRSDVVKASKLQVPTNEFVPANNNVPNTAKEPPVVSALSNAVEVTIPGKPKDRESPAKARNKAREAAAAVAVQKEPPKEVAVPPPMVAAPVVVKEVTQAVKSVPVVLVAQPSTQETTRKEESQERDLPELPSAPLLREVVQAPVQMPPMQCVIEEKMEKTTTTTITMPSTTMTTTMATEQPAKKTDSVAMENSASVNSQSAAAVANQDVAAKSKQSHRSKEQQKQAGGGQQQQQSSQKATAPTQKASKTNKMKEINLKGASKEGTDMDAFNIHVDSVTAPQNAAPIVEEPPKSIDVAAAAVAATLAMPPPEVVPEKTESNDVAPTIMPEIPKEVPKRRVDITDIVKDAPPPFTPPQVVENEDETDRAPLNEKLVAAKNEVNVKIAANAKDSEITPVHYKNSDHWSPQNQDGKKVYDRDQLMALRNYPQSKQRPDNLLPEIMSNDDRPRMGGDMARCSMGARPDFAPSFGGGGNFLGKSQSTRLAPKRNSQTGGKPSSNAKGGKSGSMIRVSISFKEDVKLHETENAWKPARLNLTMEKSDDDRKTEDLYKKVRGVLNKLTPQKFSTLVNQIKALPIDTAGRLQGVIDLVFDKAVDEPNFSVAYALMCKELALMQVPMSGESKEVVNFRKLLVTRCQIEFERNSSEENNRNGRLKEIEQCTDPEKKKEIMLLLEDDDRRIRMKSVGNIRFIGELFKQQMLTTAIMVRCLHHLIENEDEERLECLCKLLTTIGKELDSKTVDVQKIYDKMRNIVEKKHCKVSSRVRFMLQDVMDLRAGQWVPRRTDLNPKTIDQIQKEAHNEHMTIQAMNATPNPQRKDERLMSSNSDRKRGNRSTSGEDGWTVQSARNNKFQVQSEKLKFQQPLNDEPLGSREAYSTWGCGSKVKSSSSGGNMYAPLEKCNDMDNRGYNTRHKEAYNSKGSSLERSSKQYDGRNSRSGSQQRKPEVYARITAPVPPQKAAKPPQYSEEESEKMIVMIAEAYIGDEASLEDVEEVVNKICPSLYEKVVVAVFNSVLERTKKARITTGKLFSDLVIRNCIAGERYFNALKFAFAMAEDLIVDIPQIWMCYAECLYFPVVNKMLPLADLLICADCIIKQQRGDKLLAEIIRCVVQERGLNIWLDLWTGSSLSFNDFMDASKVEAFISENKLEFLRGGSSTPAALGQTNLSYDEIDAKLRYFAQSNTSIDDVFSWINMNVDVCDNKFIRILATVYVQHALVNQRLNEEDVENCARVLRRYITSNRDYEMECLYAIQLLVNQLHHPQGLLLKIFNKILELECISQQSFLRWQKVDDPLGQENKGVAVMQLTSFFTQLQEGDSDNESRESGSASED